MLTTTTATSIRFIGSRSCTAAIAQGDGGFSAVIAFGPWEASRAAASVALRPVPGIRARGVDHLLRGAGEGWRGRGGRGAAVAHWLSSMRG